MAENSLSSLHNMKTFLLMETLFFYMFIYFWEREREQAWAGEGQREKETQNPKQAPGSELSAQSPMRGLNSWTIRSWPELKSMLNQLSHVGAPNVFLFKFIFERDRLYSLYRDRVQAGEGEVERETQNLKLAPGSKLSAQSPTRGSNSQTVISWPEPR